MDKVVLLTDRPKECKVTSFILNSLGDFLECIV